MISFRSGRPGSVGEFSWGGAYYTSYWADPQEQIVAVFMSPDASGRQPGSGGQVPRAGVPGGRGPADRSTDHHAEENDEHVTVMGPPGLKSRLHTHIQHVGQGFSPARDPPARHQCVGAPAFGFRYLSYQPTYRCSRSRR